MFVLNMTDQKGSLRVTFFSKVTELDYFLNKTKITETSQNYFSLVFLEENHLVLTVFSNAKFRLS